MQKYAPQLQTTTLYLVIKVPNPKQIAIKKAKKSLKKKNEVKPKTK
jgi:hypothetical protein